MIEATFDVFLKRRVEAIYGAKRWPSSIQRNWFPSFSDDEYGQIKVLVERIYAIRDEDQARPDCVYTWLTDPKDISDVIALQNEIVKIASNLPE